MFFTCSEGNIEVHNDLCLETRSREMGATILKTTSAEFVPRFLAHLSVSPPAVWFLSCFSSLSSSADAAASAHLGIENARVVA